MDARVPFSAYRCEVLPQWIDYNGHMNVAYYVLAFDHATDAFLENINLGPGYVQATSRSVFVVDMNVTYKREVCEGAPLYVTTQLLECSDKKIRLFHQMFHESEGFLAATNELLLVHVDLDSRKGCSFPAQAVYRLEEMGRHHHSLEHPENVGRMLSL
ncbi:MAG: thioesterase family protein [Motiliproteus sp.]